MVDGTLQRPLWRALELLARIAGPVRARVIAAAFMRLGARTDRGYAKGLFRVASRLPAPMPGLWRVPPEWWAVEPRVRARRLGLDLELDLRDNLQRTLWFTGTYEPGLVRTLHDELRPGDILVDVGAHVGVHALSAARRLRDLGGGGRVIAFEPTDDSSAAVRLAATRNELPVEVVRAGLGEGDGTIELRGDPRYGAADAGVRAQFGGGEVAATAPLLALGRWAQRNPPDRPAVAQTGT